MIPCDLAEELIDNIFAYRFLQMYTNCFCEMFYYAMCFFDILRHFGALPTHAKLHPRVFVLGGVNILKSNQS